MTEASHVQQEQSASSKEAQRQKQVAFEKNVIQVLMGKYSNKKRHFALFAIHMCYYV